MRDLINHVRALKEHTRWASDDEGLSKLRAEMTAREDSLLQEIGYLQDDLDAVIEAREAAESRVRELEAQAAVMWDALEIIRKKHIDTANHRKYPSTAHVCEKALSTDAGKSLLERLEKLNFVAESAAMMLWVMSHGVEPLALKTQLEETLAAVGWWPVEKPKDGDGIDWVIERLEKLETSSRRWPWP